VPVAHACNPTYSGGRDQEDHGLKPAQANSLQDPILKKPFTKTGLVEWLKVKALSSSPSTTQKKGENPQIIVFWSFLILVLRLLWNKKTSVSWAWWYMPVIPVPGRLREEDGEFKVSLGKVSKNLSQK
jgi:hypothetical protein